jgi:hypothetical protein
MKSMNAIWGTGSEIQCHYVMLALYRVLILKVCFVCWRLNVGSLLVGEDGGAAERSGVMHLG